MEPHVIRETDDSIVVAFPMRFMGKETPPTFEHNGTIYRCGSLVSVPIEYANFICSCREYNLRISTWEELIEETGEWEERY